MNLFKEIALILTKVGPWLYPVCLLLAFTDQILTKIIQKQLTSPSGASPVVWVFALIAFFISILQPLLMTLFVSFAIKTGILNKNSTSISKSQDSHTSTNLFLFFQKYFEPALIEWLRATGKSLSWGLLFILPGIMRAFHYAFVPFVVIFSKDYDEGKIDALEISKILVKERFFQVFGVIILFSGGVPLALVGFDQFRDFLSHPIGAMVIIFIEMILSMILILNIYKQWEYAHGTDV